MSKKNAVQSTRNLKISQDKGYACVYLNRQKIMLGARYGTPEADDAFRKLQIRALTDPTLSFLTPQQVTVDSLCCAYLKYAEEHDPGHYSSVKTAVEVLLQLATGQSVESLDSRSFILLQGMFVDYGASRTYCNALMGKGIYTSFGLAPHPEVPPILTKTGKTSRLFGLCRHIRGYCPLHNYPAEHP